MLDQPKPLGSGSGFSGVLRPQQTSVSAGRARRPVRLAALRLRRFSSFVPSRERSLWSGSKPDCAVVWPARPRVRWFWLGLLLLLLGGQKVKGAVWHVLLYVIVLFVRKGGEGVLEPVTWRDPLLVVSARRCLSPCPNPSPALRASFGFKPISSVYLSIYVENYQNKLLDLVPPISALQSQWHTIP